MENELDAMKRENQELKNIIEHLRGQVAIADANVVSLQKLIDSIEYAEYKVGEVSV